MITVSKRGQTAQRHGNVFVHKAQTVGISPSKTQPKPKTDQHTMHVDKGWTFVPPEGFLFQESPTNPDKPTISFPIESGKKYTISGFVTLWGGTGKIRVRLGKDNEDFLVLDKMMNFHKTGFAGNENDELRFIIDNNQTVLATKIESLYMDIN